jgi:ketol-acid reductoisomerase
MATNIFYDADANLQLVLYRQIAIIGYGAQGAAHALNLRDSGCQVIIGQRPGKGFDAARDDGFDPVPIAAAAASADLINILLPDEVHGEVFESDIREHVQPGNGLMTCHGFSFHYGLISPPAGIDLLLVAPKGQGHMVRGEFKAGGGVPCLIATSDGATKETFQIGLAYAKALGGTRAGVIETTIQDETETDLFGEQAVLCGGVSALVQAGFETLVENGYQPELAYFECLHELKIIVDLLYSGGLSSMRDAISTTAEYGDYTRGPRVIDDSTKLEMKKILDEIQSGKFAKQFLAQYRNGHSELKAFRETNRDLPIEKIGRKLRAMMPWLEHRNETK